MRGAPQKWYDATHQRLVFDGEPATGEYWDRLWDKLPDFETLVQRGAADPLVRHITTRFLPDRTAKIIEGGCGIGQHVAGLSQLGYDVVGVDYAQQTIKKINDRFPHLSVRFGDVRSLPFRDNTFDGYWSLGVIEHFYEGYDPIIREMRRVLKPGGLAFLTFPVLSALRRFKARRGLYPTFHEATYDRVLFYQFAFKKSHVMNDLAHHNLRVIYTTPINGLKGLKDEIPALRPLLQRLYDSHYTFARLAKVITSKLLEPVSAHTILLVARNEK